MTETKIVEKKRRLWHYIGAPRRLLRKARDLYIDSMVRFDGRVGNANVVLFSGTQLLNIPNNFGRQCNKKKMEDGDGNLEQLYRSLSSKYHWNRTDFDQTRRVGRGCGEMNRSYSMALGKMGTIDEDQPCDFYENVARENGILFTRCTTYAVNRKKNNSYY